VLVARLAQDGADVGVKVVGSFGAVGYCGHTDRRERLDGAKHVEYHPMSMPMVEPKVLPRGSREQACVSEHLQLRRLEVIRRDIVP
jgi:hypothetical protein